MKIKFSIFFLMMAVGAFAVLIYQKLTETISPKTLPENGLFTASSLGGVTLSLAQQVDALKLEVSNKANHSFYSGITLPDNAVGTNGDTYLHTSSGNVYKKENNTWY